MDQVKEIPAALGRLKYLPVAAVLEWITSTLTQ